MNETSEWLACARAFLICSVVCGEAKDHDLAIIFFAIVIVYLVLAGISHFSDRPQLPQSEGEIER